MATKKTISTITVIGAGTMGHGIAEVAAVNRFNVVINDVSEDFLEVARKRVRHDLLKAIEIGKLTTEDMDAALGRIKLETKMDRAAETADLVIEAAPEKIDLKLALF